MSTDAGKLKRLSSRFGNATPPSDGHPDIAPAATPQAEAAPVPAAPSPAVPVAQPAVAGPAPAPTAAPARIDGRTLRKTGRTIQFATKVSPAYDHDIREVARNHEMMIVEVLEASLAVYRRLAETGAASGEAPEHLLERLLSGKYKR